MQVSYVGHADSLCVLEDHIADMILALLVVTLISPVHVSLLVLRFVLISSRLSVDVMDRPTVMAVKPIALAYLFVAKVSVEICSVVASWVLFALSA